MERDRIDRTATVFYRTWRAGAGRLRDGGGPFGFDIAVALLADAVITGYGCEAIAETGCFLGDTTAYLARRYPQLPVYACDIEAGFCAFTARRLAACPNMTVTCEDSPAMLARVSTWHPRTFAFLDAHWGPQWPLAEELDTLADAVAVIHDFDIGHPRFSFDAYGGVACGPGLLEQMSNPLSRYFILDPAAALPLPCLQTGRRAGVAAVAVGLDDRPLAGISLLTARTLARTRAAARS